jgi:hypothetical protein
MEFGNMLRIVFRLVCNMDKIKIYKLGIRYMIKIK